MKHLIQILFYCFIGHLLEAQVLLDTASIRQHLRQAQTSFSQYSYPDALVSANHALELFKDAPDTMLQLRADAYRIKGGIYARMSQSEEARTNLLRAADIYQQLEPLRHQFLAQIYSNVGISYAQSRPSDFTSAIVWFRKAAETILASEVPNKGLIAMDYIGNVGMAHFYLNQFKQAEETYLEAINYVEEADENNGDYIGMMEFRLGLLYERKGNLAAALQQYEQALQNYQLKIKEDPLIGNIYRNMGLLHYKRGDYEKALLYAEKARLLFAKLIGPATEEYLSALDVQSTALTELGREKLAQKTDSTKGALLKQIYKIKGPIIANHEAHMAIKKAKQQNDPNIAISGLTKVLADFKQMSEPVEEEIAQFTLELGLAYFKLQQYQLAEQQFKESLKLHEVLYSPDAGEMVQPLYSLASLYTEQADFEKALPYFEKAASACRLSNPIKINQLAYPLLAIEIMTKKAQLYAERYEKAQYPDPSDWSIADSLLYQSLKLVEMIQSGAATENSKISLQDKITPILEINLRLLWLLQERDNSRFDLTEVFNWMERGKNFVLLQSMIRSNTRTFAKLPDTLIQKEKRLQEDIAFYEKEIFLLQRGEGDQQLEKEWTDLLLELKESAAQLQALLLKEYPDYFNLKNQKFDPEFVYYLRGKLKKNEAFLEYFVGAQDIFVLKVSDQESKLFRINKAAQFDDWVTALQQSLVEAGDDFADPALSLYRQILEPLGDLPESLIIVPDGKLAYLPFEALLTGTVKKNQPYQQYPFIIKQHQISYNFSGVLWEQMRQKKYPKRGLLAFAPSFNQNNLQTASRSRNLGPLIFNQTEVEQISKLFGRKTVFLDSSATLENFQSQAQKHHLLHLATHAKIDDFSSDYSYLAFYGVKDTSQVAKLFVRDLFTLQLPLDLVTLSACETGIGTLQQGEGVVSLARGFAYAGAKSLVTSLWAANDLSTAEIMTHFYKNMKAGNNKDAALRKAKLNFIEQNNLAHPHYWATFIPVGDMGPISQAKTFWLRGFILFTLSMIAFLFYFKRKQS